MNEIELEIDRGAVRRYLVVYSSLWCFWALFVFCYPLILHAVYGVVLFFAFGLWYFHLRTNNLRYRLDGSALYVDGGILFPSRKLIPLERVTEIASYQGPLLLCFGIWTLQIQTTESPHRGEATLIGVRDPERVRDLILSRRQSVYGKKSEDA